MNQNLQNLQDKEEKYNLADKNPEKVKELMMLVEKGRNELGDKDKIGSGARFFDDVSKTERISKYEEWENSLNDKQ